MNRVITPATDDIAALTATFDQHTSGGSHRDLGVSTDNATTIDDVIPKPAGFYDTHATKQVGWKLLNPSPKDLVSSLIKIKCFQSG